MKLLNARVNPLMPYKLMSLHRSLDEMERCFKMSLKMPLKLLLKIVLKTRDNL